MRNSFRDKSPQRTFKEKRSNYRSYKKYLAADFMNRCGYCNDHHQWLGGLPFYHIDHFAPKRFSTLINDYNNLVYSCPFCNIAKKDDWISDCANTCIVNEEGYIDPCDNNYNQAFIRDENGAIIACNTVGKYMYKKLNLFLLRHTIIWNLERLCKLKEEIAEMPAFKSNSKLRDAYIELDIQYSKLFKFLGETTYE